MIHRVGAVSYALPPFLDLLGRVNRSPSRFKWNFVRLWKSMKPRVYENPHEGGTRDPRRDHVRIPKEIVLNSLAPTCPMLVQAQVVPWWGTGRPAEFSPSGFHPVTDTAHRQEDRRVRLQNRVVSKTARALHTLSRNENFFFSFSLVFICVSGVFRWFLSV